MSFWNWTTRTALGSIPITSTWSGPQALPVARPVGATAAIIEVESTSGTSNLSGIRRDGSTRTNFTSRARYSRFEIIYLNPSDDNVNTFSSSASVRMWLLAYTDHVVRLAAEDDISTLLPVGTVQTVTLTNPDIPSDASAILVRVADAVVGRFGLPGTMGAAPVLNYYDSQTIIVPIAGKQFDGSVSIAATAGQAVITGYFKNGSVTQKSPATAVAPVALNVLEELPFSFAADGVAVLDTSSNAGSHLYGVATTGGTSPGSYNAHIGNPVLVKASAAGKVSGSANNANVRFHSFAEIALNVSSVTILDIDQLQIGELTTITLSGAATATAVIVSDGEYAFTITALSQPTSSTITFTPDFIEGALGAKLGNVTVLVQTTTGDIPAVDAVLSCDGYESEILYSILGDGYTGPRTPPLTVGAQVNFPSALVDIDSFAVLTTEYEGPTTVAEIWDRSADDGLYRLHEATLDGEVGTPPVMPADTSLSIDVGATTLGTFPADSGTEPITYSLDGANADLFSINSSSALTSFLSPAVAGSGEVIIVATNSQGSDSQLVMYSVTDGPTITTVGTVRIGGTTNVSVAGFDGTVNAGTIDGVALTAASPTSITLPSLTDGVDSPRPGTRVLVLTDGTGSAEVDVDVGAPTGWAFYQITADFVQAVNGVGSSYLPGGWAVTDYIMYATAPSAGATTVVGDSGVVTSNVGTQELFLVDAVTGMATAFDIVTTEGAAAVGSGSAEDDTVSMTYIKMVAL